MIPFESVLERDFATLLEFMPDVRSYEAQPLRLDYECASGRRVHGYPDFLVTFAPGYGPPLLVDVKYRAEIGKRWKALKPRFKAAMRYAKERGWNYRLKTEMEIRTTFLGNARFLLPFLRCRPDPVHSKILMERLIALQTTTVEKLLAACARTDDIRAILIPTLWCLVAHRNIAATLDEPIGLESIIWDPLAL